MSTTLWLMRHAETVWHDGNRYTGSSDVALSAHGRHQARLLTEWALRVSLDALYSSDLSRAIETARPVVDAAHLELQVDPRLREVNFGSAEGMSAAEIRAMFPEHYARFVQSPAESPFPHAERGVDAIARALPALNEIVNEHDGETVLVVMHSTLMRLILAQVLGIDPNNYRRAFPAPLNTAITSLRVTPDAQGVWGLLGYNLRSA